MNILLILLKFPEYAFDSVLVISMERRPYSILSPASGILCIWLTSQPLTVEKAASSSIPKYSNIVSKSAHPRIFICGHLFFNFLYDLIMFIPYLTDQFFQYILHCHNSTVPPYSSTTTAIWDLVFWRAFNSSLIFVAFVINITGFKISSMGLSVLYR